MVYLDIANKNRGLNTRPDITQIEIGQQLHLAPNIRHAQISCDFNTYLEAILPVMRSKRSKPSFFTVEERVDFIRSFLSWLASLKAVEDVHVMFVHITTGSSMSAGTALEAAMTTFASSVGAHVCWSQKLTCRLEFPSLKYFAFEGHRIVGRILLINCDGTNTRLAMDLTKFSCSTAVRRYDNLDYLIEDSN